ncbi:hypothetical protein [Clostridium butyricum]|uniref:hypothetical protein n=1 Tax=Clostridium butyricum TaxID=1492 RepID=UPI000ACE93FF|nr:hypothetical protein [Clostridium butyricum]
MATIAKIKQKHFEGEFETDLITRSYMGIDSIETNKPYLESGKKGVFSIGRKIKPERKY